MLKRSASLHILHFTNYEYPQMFQSPPAQRIAKLQIGYCFGCWPPTDYHWTLPRQCMCEGLTIHIQSNLSVKWCRQTRVGLKTNATGTRIFEYKSICIFRIPIIIKTYKYKINSRIAEKKTGIKSYTLQYNQIYLYQTFPLQIPSSSVQTLTISSFSSNLSPLLKKDGSGIPGKNNTYRSIKPIH